MGKEKANVNPMKGMIIAKWVESFASATWAKNWGQMAPPQIEETRKEDPILVCLPSFLIARVKIIGKQQDSKKRTRLSITKPGVPPMFIAKIEKIMHPERKKVRTYRGLTQFIRE